MKKTGIGTQSDIIRSFIFKFKMILFLVLAGFFVACTDYNSDNTFSVNNPLKDDLDFIVDENIAPYFCNISTGSVAIGVFKDNSTRFYSYGEKQRRVNDLPDSLTFYDIGSITKTFTGIMMADYLQKNNISLETPINSLLPVNLPEFKYEGESIKIKHLLNHTSGLPNLPSDCNINFPTELYDSTRIYNYLKNITLSVKPGTRYANSNLGMGLVGTILERKTKKEYGQLLKELITDPLNLKYTKVFLNHSDSLNLATAYKSNGQVSSNSQNYWNYLSGFKGSGAIKSNLVDMMKYGKAIMDPGASALKYPISFCEEVTFVDAFKHGSDWTTLDCNGQEVLFHDGSTSGFGSYIFVCKRRRIVLVLLFSTVTDEITDYVNEFALEIIK